MAILNRTERLELKHHRYDRWGIPCQLHPGFADFQPRHSSGKILIITRKISPQEQRLREQIKKISRQ